MSKDGKKPRWTRRLALLYLLGALVVGGALGYAIRGIAWSDLIVALVIDDAGESIQTKNLVRLVERHLLLPDEEPIVASIDDPDKLIAEGGGQYQGVQQGDKILTFPADGKVVVYSPERNIVVNSWLEPVNRPAAKTLQIDVRNGTDDAVALENVQRGLAQFGFTVATTSQAKNSYTEPILVDLSQGKAAEELTLLEQVTGLTPVTELPAGEEASEHDIVILIGNQPPEAGATDDTDEEPTN